MAKAKRKKDQSGRTASDQSDPTTVVSKDDAQESVPFPNYHKPFRGLPAEIRMEIWRHIPVNVIVIDSIARRLAKETKSPPEHHGLFNTKLGLLRQTSRTPVNPWTVSSNQRQVNFLLVNKQVNAEYRSSSLGQSALTLSLLYMHMWFPGRFWSGSYGPTLPNMCKNWPKLVASLPGNFLPQLETINYRPLRDDKGRDSICLLLRHLASTKGSQRFPRVKNVRYIVDFEDLVTFKSSIVDWKAWEHGGKSFTASRPSLYWSRGLSILTASADRERKEAARYGEPLGPQQHIPVRLDELIIGGHIDRFEIQLLNVPDHQKHLVDIKPFEPDFSRSSLKDGLIMGAHWEYTGNKRWNGFASLEKRISASTEA